jgi:hypothetical protein
MKTVIPIALLLTSCVTYPRYVKKYDCNDQQKANLPVVVNTCISNFKDSKVAKEISDTCYDIALKSLCSPTDYFERVNVFGNVGSAIPCKYSVTYYENFICDGY